MAINGLQILIMLLIMLEVVLNVSMNYKRKNEKHPNTLHYKSVLISAKKVIMKRLVFQEDIKMQNLVLNMSVKFMENKKLSTITLYTKEAVVLAAGKIGNEISVTEMGTILKEKTKQII